MTLVAQPSSTHLRTPAGTATGSCPTYDLPPLDRTSYSLTALEFVEPTLAAAFAPTLAPYLQLLSAEEKSSVLSDIDQISSQGNVHTNISLSHKDMLFR
jgi:hypothetical protein